MGETRDRRRLIKQALAEFRAARDAFGLMSDEAEAAAVNLRAVIDLQQESAARTELLRYYYDRAFDQGPAGAAALAVWRELLEIVAPGWDDDRYDPGEGVVVVNMDTGQIIGPEGPWEDPDADNLLERVQSLIDAAFAEGNPGKLAQAASTLMDSDGNDPVHIQAAVEFGAELGRIADGARDPHMALLAVTLLEWTCDMQQDPMYLDQLGSHLHSLYDLTSAENAILRAIEVRRRALELLDEDSPEYPNIEGGLCAVLWAHGQLRDIAELDEALERLPRVIDHPMLDPSIRPGWIWNLGTVLRDRGELASDGGSISEAISVHELALQEAEAHPRATVNVFEIRWSMATTINIWWRYSHNPDAQVDSIQMYRNLLAQLPPDSPRLAPALNDFGAALDDLPYGDGSAARESAETLRRALSLTGPDDAIRPRVLANLVTSLRTPVVNGAVLSPEAADELVALATESVAKTPHISPELGHRLNHLGLAHAARLGLHHAATDLDDAIQAFRASAEHEPAPLWVRWNSYNRWVETAAAGGAWESAAEGCAGLVSLIPLASGELLRRRDREIQLTKLGDAIRDGAAAALTAGRVDQALELLESGRGVLLGHAMSRTAAIGELRAKAPDHVDDYIALRKLLDQDDGSQRMIRDIGDTARRNDAANRLNDLMQQIRARPGLEEFPATGQRHAARTSAEPVVVLNLSKYRSDAIIVGTRVGEPIVIRLPLVTPDHVASQVGSLYDALDQRDSARNDPGRLADVEETVASVLSWTWDSVVDPVLAGLRYSQPRAASDRPHIWWSPSGALTLLPLHAALRRADEAAPALCALECVVSSYTPTASALHKTATPLTPQPSAAVIAMPSTLGYQDLPGVKAEAASVAENYSGAVEIIGPAATHDTVATALSTTAIAHFACHAVNEPNDPSRGGLVLADGTLSVAELSVQDLSHAFLAYLSACDTARGGTILTDEAITICTGLYLAGFANAVGTLWPVDDAVAAFLATKFHDALGRRLRNGAAGEPAVILNQLTEWASRGWRNRPSRWATLIHVGG